MNDRNDNGPPKDSLDATIARRLSVRYRSQSRRAFLSRVTRSLIGFAGVAVASEVLPFFASTARADTNCGLHGYLCSSGTTCSGGIPGYAWVQCCSTDTCPQSYSCCKYTDYCGTRPAGWGSNCGGTTPAGPSWCGSAPGAYLCTSVSCIASYGSLAECNTGCVTYPHC